MEDKDRVQFFVNGTAMRGGALHAGLGGAEFIREATTSPNYQFLAYNREFPGLRYVAEDGAAISGELYSVRLQQLFETFLPSEPDELELGVISLADNSHVLGMVVRNTIGELKDWEDISRFAGWRAYHNSLLD